MLKNIEPKKEITDKDFFLFLLPVAIWTWCLVKAVHQIIYTWRIRNITKKVLQKKKYLENLWS